MKNICEKQNNCNHEWRFQERLKYKTEIVSIFYCIHCLVQSTKWGDFDLKEIFKQHAKLNKEWSKKRAKRINKK